MRLATGAAMHDAKELERYTPAALVVAIISTLMLIFWGRW
jgi:hypothetical protein